MNKIKKRRQKPRSDKGKKRPNYTPRIPTIQSNLIRRANAMGVRFDLTTEEVLAICSRPCIYCGATKCTVGLMDKSEGYHIDNSVSSCEGCDKMKGDLSTSQFISLVSKIHKYQTI